ncbi:MAG: nitrite/sulfite reductase [Burkholderiales bacterium]|jgi:sulfite reductase (NADPH) hemoprotein beta-component|tara:strand:- start:2064 stop:3722 length:1659 start_codon:yes stop_codon:yes gene_type:complete
MYKYDLLDQSLVDERVAQYKGQLTRFLNKELTEEEFRPLRLQNGLYIQRHAPMLRVAVPYGLLSSTQLNKLADISDKYDRGYGHFSTRQNIQFNWPKLEDTPQILKELATVEMHAIQTSGNCIRNITTDQFSGVTPDEIIDPRYLAEIIRQWSTFHPEFALLPRKFKIAITGSSRDRAIVQAHDIGLEIFSDEDNEMAIKVWVGGGLGRTPILGSVIKENLSWKHILTYSEAILRVYNLYGRRDNMYKARIKILVKALGIEKFKELVEREWASIKDGPNTIDISEINRIKAFFSEPNYKNNKQNDLKKHVTNKSFSQWLSRCTHSHKKEGYRSVTLSLKSNKQAPGDATSDQMRAVASLADQYSFGEIRVSHEQNLILADVLEDKLYELWEKAKVQKLTTPNVGLLTDIICCPGGDFCSLANAKSIPIANSIQDLFDDMDYLHDIGEINLNISGCMNACGHHHVGHIGILGVDKDGSEWYQLTLGGNQGNFASIGKVIGPSFSEEELPGVIKKIISTFIKHRHLDEIFIDCVSRIGLQPFKEAVYGKKEKKT